MATAAKIYSTTSSWQRALGRKLVTLPKLSISRGATVLDLGCGTGETTAEIADLVGPEGRVIAVDPDEERIKLAKEMNARPNIIEYHIGGDKTFPDGKYDAVVMNAVIHWIKDKEALYRKLYSNMSPGGQVAISTSGTRYIAPAIESVLETLHPGFVKDVYLPSWYCIEPTEQKRLQEAAGFKLEYYEEERRYVELNTAQECVEWFFGVVHGRGHMNINMDKVQVSDEDIKKEQQYFDMELYVIQK